MSMRINDYVFETLLGRGTFGSVYLVRRKRDSKPFVVKEQVLNAVNALPVKNILGEVQTLHTLRHPNIVAYYGAWMEDDRSYILMEYATRCTLKDLLDERHTPLKEEDALYLFSQIVLGVHHIHFKKILHRDLKPENIMLTGNRGDIVKIGDFGVSKNFQESRDPSTACRAGSFYYMAPEMLKGHPYDFKCDVWNMGVILYEMITKRLPFPGTLLISMERIPPPWTVIELGLCARIKSVTRETQEAKAGTAGCSFYFITCIPHSHKNRLFAFSWSSVAQFQTVKSRARPLCFDALRNRGINGLPSFLSFIKHRASKLYLDSCVPRERFQSTCNAHSRLGP
ncbi:serine/threonine-protein kinase Nek5 isoform X1 [Andrena cerasifolii]|uniref:serine/threonine-protein kinase Nek5 isoform X1 n=1 Tax=Andrena cerasifolii TaxID=2819439 RepID=UPI00403789C8